MVDQALSIVVSARLRDLRVAKGKTIGEMADDTGIGASAIRNYEVGLRTPCDSNKLTIARYFGKTVDDLFYSPPGHDT